MAEDGKIIYQVEVNSDRAVSEAKQGGERAGEAFSSGGKKHGGLFQEVMIGAARKVGEAFVNMAGKAIQGVEKIAQAGIEFNAKMEKYQTAFTTLIGDADAAAAAIEQIREDAAKTPFDVDSLTAANQALLATGMSAGDARNDVLNLANAIAATGGGSAELSRMAANMQQIRNTGKATAMDIRQFANAGINIYGLLADSMGITAAEAAELDVTYEQLTEAFAHAAEEGGIYAGAMEAQSQTFLGQMSTIKDNATQLAGTLTQDLFGALSENVLPQVQEWVSTLLEAAQENGISGAISAAKEILSNLVNSFIEGLPEMMDTGLEMIENFINGLASGDGHAGEKIGEILLTIITKIVEHFPKLLEAGVNLINHLVQGMGSVIDTLVEPIQDGIENILTKWQEAIDNAKQWGSDLVQSLIDGIKEKISAVGDAAREVAGKVREFLHFSEPDEGPLSDFHTYAPDMMKLFASGIEGNAVLVTHAIEDAFDIAPAIEGATFAGVSPDAYVSDRIAANAGLSTSAEGGINSLAQMVSDGFQSIGSRGSGVNTAILNVNGREFCRAIFEDQQIVTNDHGMSLIVT